MSKNTTYNFNKSSSETLAFFDTYFSKENEKRSLLVDKRYLLRPSIKGQVNNWIKEELLLDKELASSSDIRFSLDVSFR
jgi:hypothetical protein